MTLFCLILLMLCIETGTSFSHIGTGNTKKSLMLETTVTNRQKVGSDEVLGCGDGPNNRRVWLQNTVAMATATATATAAAIGFPRSSNAAETLPFSVRGYTKLAPLGPKSSISANQKTTNLSPDEMARRLSVDLVHGAHGKGGYFLTGDISQDLFREDCVFEDPTNRVDSLSQYQKALSLLFDPERSTVQLLGNGLTVQQEGGLTTTTTIQGRLRSRGFLKVAPWKPYVKAYETTIVYTLDPSTGLVARQDQKWSKDASEALKETFTPSWNGEAPKSSLQATYHEPKAVKTLFAMLNGRRPNEYSEEERREINEIINEIVNLQTATATATGNTNTNTNTNNSPGLAGTWVLVYLQPGPNGAGIDRRIPFPDFDFNDSFQVFESSINERSADKVTNIGQVLGSLADVRVSGSLREIVNHQATNKRRFEATIEGGRLCFGGFDSSNCPINLPMIQGTGIFESLYLGDRLRIGQNINGGGARVVQVRL